MATTDREGGAGAIGAINRGFGALAGWCFDHRWWVIALSAAAVAGAAWLAGTARIDNSYEAFFAPGDPSYRAYLAYRDDFGSDEVSYLMYEAPDAAEGVFDLGVMSQIARLTKAIEDEVPFLYQVKSVTNAELVEPTADGIRIRRLWRDFPHTQAAMNEARAIFLAKPLYVGGLVARDTRFGAISIEMDRTSTDPVEKIRLDPNGGDGLGNLYPQVTSEKIEEILARPEYAGLRFYHSGDVPMNTAYNRIIEREDDLLMMISMAVIAAVLAVFVRSVVGVIGPLVVVVIAVVGTVAFIAVWGWKLDLMFGQVPNILVTVGVAEAVHLLIEFRSTFHRLGDRRSALMHTMYLLGAPCLLTSLTTAAGFLALQVAPVVAIAHMAVYSAVGVVLAFVFTMTLVPALVSFGPRTQVARSELKASEDRKGGRRAAAAERAEHDRMHRALTAVAAWNVRHRRAVLAAFAVISIASAVGIGRLRVDSNWLDDFSDRVPLKAATARIDSVMGGMSNLIYIFDTGKEDGIREPQVLRAIDRLQREAERDDLVRKTYSIVDIVKDLNQSFHDGDPAFFAVPDDRQLVSQLLLLYETSGGEEVKEWATSDFARANLELRLGIAPVSRTSDLVAKLGRDLAQHPIPGTRVSLSGIGALWLELLDYIVASEVESFLYAFVLIGAMMCFIFRSFKTGMLSMVPNLWPILLTLGAMGWLDIPLDYNKVMIASVAMGIAVDDTIHFVSRCHHEFTERGSYAEALAAAMADVGHAVAVTSLVLVLGFMVNVFSVLDANAKSGILLATTIGTALLADLLLTPALLLTLQPFGPEGSRRAELREAA
jgi:predicted RND superfamily exporter protein